MLCPCATTNEPIIASIIMQARGMPRPTDKGLKNIDANTTTALKPMYGKDSKNGIEKNCSRVSFRSFAFSKSK